MNKSDDNFSLNKTTENKLLLAELANIIHETFLEEQIIHLEPFENYAHQLKLHMQSDIRTFRRRLMRGYEVLLETLDQKEYKN